VDSINTNSKNLNQNTKNVEMLDLNLENLEKSTKIIQDTIEKLNDEQNDNWNDIFAWSKNVVDSIEQLRNMVSENSKEVS
jgi:hypothetical protein